MRTGRSLLPLLLVVLISGCPLAFGGEGPSTQPSFDQQYLVGEWRNRFDAIEVSDPDGRWTFASDGTLQMDVVRAGKRVQQQCKWSIEPNGLKLVAVNARGKRQENLFQVKVVDADHFMLLSKDFAAAVEMTRVTPAKD